MYLGEGTVVKLSAMGKIEWSTELKSYDPMFKYFMGGDITQTEDKGYLFCGVNEKWTDQLCGMGEECNPTIPTGAVVKIDSQGTLVWKKEIKDPHISFGYGRSWCTIRSFSDSYVLTGTHTVSKQSLDGKNILWEKKYSGNNTVVWTAHATAEEGVVVGLEKMIGLFAASPLTLLQLDKQGQEIWKKEFDGKTEGGEHPNTLLRQTADGGFMLGISNQISKNNYDDVNSSQGFTLFKLNQSGDIMWKQPIAPSQYLAGIAPMIDGYLITHPYKIRKLNLAGEQLWQREVFDIIDSTQYKIVSIGPVLQSKESGYFMATGYFNKKNSNLQSMWLQKLDMCGNVCK